MMARARVPSSKIMSLFFHGGRVTCPRSDELL